MRRVWNRANTGIGVRLCVLLVLLTAFLFGMQEGPDQEVADPAEQPDKHTDSSAIGLAVSTHHARPGQRIGIRISAKTNLSADVALMVNGSVSEERALPASGQLDLVYEVPASGPVLLGAELRRRTNAEVMASNPAAEIVNVAAASKILILSTHQSVFADSLRRGGWPVTERTATVFADSTDALNDTSMLVLDDISIADFPADIWARIDSAVRLEGLSMLVLAGPNSFSLGGYRESQLEGLLPVISEPPDYEAPASLMFLVDVSGSMDRPVKHGNRLQVARQAVIETSQALRTVDSVGLMSFDVESREHLPLAPRANHGAVLAQVFPEAASGGTHLVPALRRAIQQLEADANSQDILVVVTDGSASQGDLDELKLFLAGSHVEIIALIIAGANDNTAESLVDIVQNHGGRAVQIDDFLRLPSLMRNQVEMSRPAVVEGRSRVLASTAISWLPIFTGAPEVDRYLLTRPREDATVLFRSPRGDVIMASNNVGAGEVIAVTSGFSDWTGNWLLSDDWPSFAANLARRLSTRDSGEFAINVYNDNSSNTILTVDRIDRASTSSIRATLVSPSNASSEIELQPTAPGRVSTALPLFENGEYLVALDDGLSTTRYRFIHSRQSEMPTAESAPEASDTSAIWSRQLICLALILFLTVLIWERRPPI